jgi:hypothetical protein
MRSLRRRVPLATLAMMAALPAQARLTAPATTTAATTVCDQAVCESATGVGFTVHSGQGQRPPGPDDLRALRDDHQDARTLTLTNSPPICASQPSYLFVVRKTFPAGTTIAMQFISSPPTPGRPVVRLPLR